MQGKLAKNETQLQDRNKEVDALNKHLAEAKRKHEEQKGTIDKLKSQIDESTKAEHKEKDESLQRFQEDLDSSRVEYNEQVAALEVQIGEKMKESDQLKEMMTKQQTLLHSIHVELEEQQKLRYCLIGILHIQNLKNPPAYQFFVENILKNITSEILVRSCSKLFPLFNQLHWFNTLNCYKFFLVWNFPLICCLLQTGLLLI